MSNQFDDDMRVCLPFLRAYARSLTDDRERADNLVRKVVLRGIGLARHLRPETDVKIWMFSMLRRLYLIDSLDHRRAHHDRIALNLTSYVRVSDRCLNFADFKGAFHLLSDGQREALALIVAEGFSYEEAVTVLNCPISTLKCRVVRAKRTLKAMLCIDGSQQPANQAHVTFH